MFTEALAVSYYGRARTTRDVDVVVAVGGEKALARLVSALRRAGLVIDEGIKLYGSAYCPRLSSFISSINCFIDSASFASIDMFITNGRVPEGWTLICV